jgi:hypothetical protein
VTHTKTETAQAVSDFEIITLIIKARDIPMRIKEWPNGFVVGLEDDIYLDFDARGTFEGARYENE